MIRKLIFLIFIITLITTCVYGTWWSNICYYEFTGGNWFDSGPAGKNLILLGSPAGTGEITPGVAYNGCPPEGWGYYGFDENGAASFQYPNMSNGKHLILGTSPGGVGLMRSKGVKYQISWEPNGNIGINPNPVLMKTVNSQGTVIDEIVLWHHAFDGQPAQIIFSMFDAGLGITVSVTITQDENLGGTRWGGSINSGYNRVIAGYDPEINKLFVKVESRSRIDWVSYISQTAYSAELPSGWANGLTNDIGSLWIGGDQTRGMRVGSFDIDKAGVFQGNPGEPYPRQVPPMPSISSMLDIQKITPKGQYYQDTVPDTLDLAERARLSINAIIRTVIGTGPSFYSTLSFGVNPPVEEGIASYSYKQVRSLPKLRTMCGSTLNLETELNLMQYWLGQLSWAMNAPVNMHPIHGATALAVINWYARDGNPDWLQWLRGTAIGIENKAIQNSEYAYFDLGHGEPVQDPPTSCDGSVKYDYSFLLRPLSRNYVYNQDSLSADLGDKVTNFLILPKMWDSPDDPDYSVFGFTPLYPGYQNGIWSGHSHAGLTGLHGLLSHAISVNNYKLKQLVLKAYEHARATGIPRIGWNPLWFPPCAHGCSSYCYAFTACEPCSMGDIVVLAVMLTDAGIGDFWDDIDYFVRNCLAEQQITDVNVLRQISGSTSPVLDKYVGSSVAGCRPAWAEPITWGGCCLNNTAIAFYYAWHGIVRYDDSNDVAQINLLLNRASKWLDIYSFLPYEGKVEIRNKTAGKVRIRMPDWVGNMNTVACYVNNQPVQASVDGRYLIIENLVPNDLIRLMLPLSERVENYNWNGQTYAMTFRGSTLVNISPDYTAFLSEPTTWDSRSDAKYPLWQRSYMRISPAPTRTVSRFISDVLIPLQGESGNSRCYANLKGDFNRDCIVNFTDFSIFAENWLIER